jgi:hypothetical protein
VTRPPAARPRRAIRGLAAALVCLLCTLGASAAVAATATGPTVDLSSDPWFVGWSEALPPAYLGVDTDSSDVCVAGRIQCVDRVARRLAGQVASLRCDHNAVFSLAYARTTEAVARFERADPSFFADTPWLDHYDATFADFYFTAWNRPASAPPAWRIAFTAADQEQVSAAGNLLLGLNAHVNRDLPFTLYAIGLVGTDGASRKPDHDRVNQILDQVLSPLLDEIAARYDPSVRTVPGIGSLADFLEFQILPAWREEAWRNAELLASAPDAAARAAVAAAIEQAAADEANLIVALTRYTPPLTSSAARDAYCQSHLG